MNELKQGRSSQNCHNGKGSAESDTESGSIYQKTLQIFVVLCPKGFGCRYAKAYAGALYKSKNQEIKGIGGSYGS